MQIILELLSVYLSSDLAIESNTHLSNEPRHALPERWRVFIAARCDRRQDRFDLMLQVGFYARVDFLQF